MFLLRLCVRAHLSQNDAYNKNVENNNNNMYYYYYLRKRVWMLMDGTFVVDFDLLPRWLQPLADTILEWRSYI